MTREHYTLYVCGTRGSVSVSGVEFLEFGGETSCYVLCNGIHAIIVDCGTGLRRAARFLQGCEKIDVILTHVHYDHMIGLLAWTDFPPQAEVRIFGTFEQWMGEANLNKFFRRPFWPFVPDLGQCVNVLPNSTMELSYGVTAQLCTANHPDDASIIRVDTSNAKVCFAFDYEYNGQFPDHMAQNCDVMVYDGMYTEEEVEARRGWGHSYWRTGWKVAQRTNVKRLLITHHDPKRTDAQLRAMERDAKELSNTIAFARVGDQIPL